MCTLCNRVLRASQKFERCKCACYQKQKIHSCAGLRHALHECEMYLRDFPHGFRQMIAVDVRCEIDAMDFLSEICSYACIEGARPDCTGG